MEPDLTHQEDEEPEGMGPVAKVIRVNLIILLIYAALLFISNLVGNANTNISEWVVMVGMGMMAHGVVNLILGILYLIMKKTGLGKGALLCGLLLLIIGFSSCTAAFSMNFH